MPIAFDRNTCCDLNETISREWLITNGRGGYAAGTIAGTLTRREHGLLAAPLISGDTPQLLVAKLDEEIVFDHRTYYLGTNEYKDGTLNPAGFVHLESFHMEEGFPVFTYHLGGIDGIVLEKRIWMPRGLNTTYIHYRVVRTAEPAQSEWQSQQLHQPSRFLEDAHASQRVLTLTLLPLTSYRSIHETLHGTFDWQFEVEPQSIEPDPGTHEQPQSIAGCTIRARDGAGSYHIFVVGHPDSQTTFLPTGVWYWNFAHRENQATGQAGQPTTDDLYLPGVFRAKLWPGDNVELTVVLTCEDLSRQSFNARQLKRAYTEAVEYQRSLSQVQRYFGEGGVTIQMPPVLWFPEEQPGALSAEEFLRTLLQAGSRFLVERALPLDEVGGRPSTFFSNTEIVPTILSGFYDMEERTRDMLIALPGLTLTTHRYAEARRILLSLSRYFREGLLPDRLPTLKQPLTGEDYQSADTTLWYFYALDAYLQATQDDSVLEDLFPHLESSIANLRSGTRNNIRVDRRDGLLLAHQHGKGEESENVPLLLRAGKPVEVNALWYHALSLMQEWSERLYRRGSIARTTDAYIELSQQCKCSFNERFWYGEGGYLYDVIDGPLGNDASLRPNQLFALSLGYPVLEVSFRRAVLDIVTMHLLTPYGLRSLAPHYESHDEAGTHSGLSRSGAGKQGQSISNQYNGGTWPWLVGAYIDALFQVEGVGEEHDSHDEAGSYRRALVRKKATWLQGVELLASYRRMSDPGILGMPPSVYDGDQPQRPHAQLASARSVGELLRVYRLLTHLGMRYSDRTLPV